MSYKLLMCAVFLSGMVLLRLRYRNHNIIRYKEYLLKFNKRYSEEEFTRRFQYFEASLKEIDILDSAERGTGAKHGFTKYSDWSKDELMAKTYLGFVGVSHQCIPKANNNCTQGTSDYKISAKRNRTIKSHGFPDNFDWRDKSKIGPVQNQKQCNGCWAFGIVGVMESMAAINNGILEQLSVQELLDCSDTTDKCNGGNIDNALEFLCSVHHMGITTEDKYPLMLINEDCKRPLPSGGKKLTRYDVSCKVSDEDIIEKLSMGPVIAVINPEPWPSYIEGIIQYNCDVLPSDNFFHVIIIVGYDRRGDVPFYTVKNSWGEDWGEEGYVRLAMGAMNTCGIKNHLATLDVV